MYIYAGYKMGENSLAVRLPSAVVEADLKASDQIEIRVTRRDSFEIARDGSKAKAIERIRRLRRTLPLGFKFSRLDAN